jgi:hypothetical protein
VLFRFEEAELDTAAYELRVDGARVPVAPQVFEVLTYLVEHRDRLVPRTEILHDPAPIRQRNSAGRSGYRFQPDGQDHIQSPFLEVAFHECTRSEKTSVSI